VRLRQRLVEDSLDEPILRARLRLAELSSSLSLDDFLRATLNEVESLTSSSTGYYAIVQENKATVAVTTQSTNALEHAMASVGFVGVGEPLDGETATKCIEHRRPIVRTGSSRHASELAVPILRNERIVALVVVRGNPGNYTHRDIDLLSLFADLTWDIAERKRAEEALRASETNYREVFDKANDGVLIHDLETGEMLDANQKIFEIYGYTPEEMRKLKISAISANEPPYSQRDAIAWIRKAGREQPQLFEWLARDRNGRLFWVEVSLKRAKIGGVDRLLGIVRDISERKNAENETQRLRETLAHVTRVSTLGELAASLAHELNQPLAAILTNTHAALRVMRSTQTPQEDVEEILADIAADGERAGEIIRRIREPLRRGQLSVEPLNIDDLISDIRTLVRTDALLAGIAVEIEGEPNLPQVTGDRIQIQQVLLNLMMNALDAVRTASPERRRVQVRASSAEQDMVRIEVSDTGPGMPTHTRESIFEPFFTTKPGGLGLGLTICRTLIEAHGGHIYAKDPSPGDGTTLVVLLPADRSTA